MSSVVIAGDVSGTVTLDAPAVAGTTVLTLPSTSGTLATLQTAGFPAGTRMSFQQTAAPTGWTKDTTAAIDDSILRLVTGSVTTGGSTAFSTFNGQTAVGATTLAESQMPSHVHTVQRFLTGSGPTLGGATGNSSLQSLNPNTAAAGGGGSHTHSLTTNIKYCDFIIASKD